MGPFPADPVTMMSRVKRGASEWLGGMWWCGGNERGTSWKTGITRAVMGRGERKYYIGGGEGGRHTVDRRPHTRAQRWKHRGRGCLVCVRGTSRWCWPKLGWRIGRACVPRADGRTTGWK